MSQLIEFIFVLFITGTSTPVFFGNRSTVGFNSFMGNRTDLPYAMNNRFVSFGDGAFGGDIAYRNGPYDIFGRRRDSYDGVNYSFGGINSNGAAAFGSFAAGNVSADPTANFGNMSFNPYPAMGYYATTNQNSFNACNALGDDGAIDPQPDVQSNEVDEKKSIIKEENHNE